MKIETVEISKISPDPDNPNKMSKDQMEALRKSIKKFGYLQPVIVNKEGKIIDGEHRFFAYMAMEKKEIPVVRVDLKKGEEKLLRQVMNKLRGKHDSEKDSIEATAIINAGMENELKELLAISEKELEMLKNATEKTNYKKVEFLAKEKKNECPRCGFKY